MTARGLVWRVCVAVVVLGLPTEVSAQGWSNKDIDSWIQDLENQASLADGQDDFLCSSILSDSALGYLNARDTDGVHWNRNLMRNRGAYGLTTRRSWKRLWGLWRGVDTKIEIDPAAPNPLKTAIHEGVHGSGYVHEDVVHEWERTGVMLGCTEAYFPTSQN